MKKKDKDSEKPDTFVEKLAVHLTKNLQVNMLWDYQSCHSPSPLPQVLVRDIHVRYEDSITKPGTTLSAGATLHSLEVKVRMLQSRILGSDYNSPLSLSLSPSVQSTDDKWVPTVVREAATVIYKVLGPIFHVIVSLFVLQEVCS